jgi:hypothetical protein
VPTAVGFVAPPNQDPAVNEAAAIGTQDLHPSNGSDRGSPSPYPGPVEHYANAFTLTPEHCFRMIHAEGTGHAQHCPYLMVWRGRFKDGAGRWHTVKACDGHRADLDAVQRIA